MSTTAVRTFEAGRQHHNTYSHSAQQPPELRNSAHRGHAAPRRSRRVGADNSPRVGDHTAPFLGTATKPSP